MSEAKHDNKITADRVKGWVGGYYLNNGLIHDIPVQARHLVTEQTARKFLQRLINNQHGEIVEAKGFPFVPEEHSGKRFLVAKTYSDLPTDRNPTNIFLI